MKLARLLALPTALAPALVSGAHAGAPNHGGLTPNNLAPRASQKAKNFTFDQLYHMQRNFLDNFLYPKNSAQVSPASLQAQLLWTSLTEELL